MFSGQTQMSGAKMSRTETTERILGALISALVIACLLSFVRGGFDATPFFVFVVAGFVAAICWQAFSRPGTLSTIEKALRRFPNHAAIRFVLVVGLLTSLVVWSGPIITKGGFGGWLIALLVCMISQPIICSVAPRFPILFGVPTGACIVLSCRIENSRLYSKQREIQWSHAFDESGALLQAWAIAALVSLIISIPVHLQRRTMKSSSLSAGGLPAH
jgi:hypothetical protein